jgi:hypothetical protein
MVQYRKDPEFQRYIDEHRAQMGRSNPELPKDLEGFLAAPCNGNGMPIAHLLMSRFGGHADRTPC